jgi:hypothetical protein
MTEDDNPIYMINNCYKTSSKEMKILELSMANVIRNWALRDQNFILNNLAKDIVKTHFFQNNFEKSNSKEIVLENFMVTILNKK